MDHAAYRRYLRSAEWRARREAAAKRAGHRCERCKRPLSKYFNVHHRTYARLGNERPEDLEVLCGTCHARTHGIAA